MITINRVKSIIIDVKKSIRVSCESLISQSYEDIFRILCKISKGIKICIVLLHSLMVVYKLPNFKPISITAGIDAA